MVENLRVITSRRRGAIMATVETTTTCNVRFRVQGNQAIRGQGVVDQIRSDSKPTHSHWTVVFININLS